VAVLGVLGQCLYPPWTIARNCCLPAARLPTVWANGVYRPLFAPPGQRWLEENGESYFGYGSSNLSLFRVSALVDWGRLGIGILGWLAFVSLVAVLLGIHKPAAKSPEEKRP